jgi:hypothetical protein
MVGCRAVEEYRKGRGRVIVESAHENQRAEMHVYLYGHLLAFPVYEVFIIISGSGAHEPTRMFF